MLRFISRAIGAAINLNAMWVRVVDKRKSQKDENVRDNNISLTNSETPAYCDSIKVWADAICMLTCLNGI